MQPNVSTSQLIRRIAKKEITLFFASPIAYLFLAVFAGFTLFVFFWGQAFFSRNIADVRPLFASMPLLLIFLASTLTMRLWSEERRTGTLEHVLTQPVPLWNFVLGKFTGCLILLLLALSITLPIPITVSLLGDLDWGPVFAGYLATFLLGAAYLSIGLFVSAKSQNQIVSLITSVALCGVFYLVGSDMLTRLVGYEAAELMRLFGTGSRFESITRGVLDFRDIFYYISLIVVFLSLNTYSLEKERWAKSEDTRHHNGWRMVTALMVLNAIGGNLWLGQVTSARIDATEGKQYTISDSTERYLAQLQEPLLIRGYFSAKTHPLLSPLVPQLQNLMQEYEIAGQGKVRIEFIDPVSNPELEQEANQKFGIRPMPFQVADRYQSSIVSSYFNVLIQYGDEHEVIGFQDLIEVKSSGISDIDVQLRNPEHDMTRAIKKVLKSYQSGGNLFDTVAGTLVFDAYISNNALLPEELRTYKASVENALSELKVEAGDRLEINFHEPEANNGEIAQKIANDFGFQPMATSLFSNETFYFYLTLTRDDQIVQIPLDDMEAESFNRNMDAAIKRFATGFTKTVAVVTQPSNPQMAMYGMGGPQFQQLESFIGAELNIEREELSDGRVSPSADILLLLAPKDLDEKQVFAIDQFLMQGGTVIAATSPFSASFQQQQLSLSEHNSGLNDWLAHHGISIDSKVVMDQQNTSFPIPVRRDVGGFSLQEIQMVDYPYFIDIRDDGFNQESVITSDIPQATVVWASPINLDEEKNINRQVIELINTSETAWLSSSTDIMPKFDENGLNQYPLEGQQASHLLAVVTQGKFDSFYKGKSSPLSATKNEDEADETNPKTTTEENTEKPIEVTSVIEKSSNSARIIVFSSNDFLSDRVLGMLGSAAGSQYLNTAQLVANTVDWSLEDTGLLGIRSRGHFNRTLPPMERSTQQFWEYVNYGLAAFTLIVIAFIQRMRRRASQKQFQQLLAA